LFITLKPHKPHYGNVPFEVPDGWCWCKLDDLAFYKKGPFGSSLTKSMFVPDSPNAYKVYEQKNAISKDATLGHYFIDRGKYDELKGFAVQPEDIIVSCAGTIGETYVLPLNIREGIINQALMTIRLFDKSISDFYLLYFDFILKREAAKESKGTAIKNIPPFDILKNFFIPLPPPKEQIRIIEKVSYWLSFVDAIDSEESEMSNLISKTKSKILDLAIHGKLVLQDPNDEPAIELLKRINPNFTPCDNGHYQNLPAGWAMCKLSDLCRIENGFAFSSNDYKPQGIPLVRISNIIHNTIDITDCVYIEGITDNKFKISKGDLLIAMSGATTGKMGVYPFDETAYLNQRVGNIKILNKSSLSPVYRNTYMQSKVDEILKIAYGGAQPNISASVIGNFDFPLPPYKEQIRIIETVQRIFDQLDVITESL
jgi:type I restriction enzyme S subunit